MVSIAHHGCISNEKESLVQFIGTHDWDSHSFKGDLVIGQENGTDQRDVLLPLNKLLLYHKPKFTDTSYDALEYDLTCEKTYVN